MEGWPWTEHVACGLENTRLWTSLTLIYYIFQLIMKYEFAALAVSLKLQINISSICSWPCLKWGYPWHMLYIYLRFYFGKNFFVTPAGIFFHFIYLSSAIPTPGVGEHTRIRYSHQVSWYEAESHNRPSHEKGITWDLKWTSLLIRCSQPWLGSWSQSLIHQI